MKKNKKGFIATSLIYSFFLMFLMILILTVTDYAHNRLVMGELKRSIQEELSGYITSR